MKKTNGKWIEIKTLGDLTYLVNNNSRCMYKDICRVKKSISRTNFTVLMLDVTLFGAVCAISKLYDKVEELEKHISEIKNPDGFYPQIEREDDIGGSHITVKFDKYETAVDAMRNFNEIVSKSGSLRETDIWKNFGYPFSFSDKGLGWTDISKVNIKKENGLYVIRFPVPYPVK